MLQRRVVLQGLLATGIGASVAAAPGSGEVERLADILAEKLKDESGDDWRVMIDRKAGVVAFSRAARAQT